MNLGKTDGRCQVLHALKAQPNCWTISGYDSLIMTEGPLRVCGTCIAPKPHSPELGRRLACVFASSMGAGGTTSCSGGPAHRFVKAMPCGTLDGDLRMTEQGETIAQKYANRIVATHNLELLFAGVTRATLLDLYCPEPEHPLAATMDRLAERSRRTYTDLLDTEGFLTFFRQATPIDAIEESRIGSRPAFSLHLASAALRSEQRRHQHCRCGYGNHAGLCVAR